MSGLFVPLDANYQDDPKILRAGALAELVHIRGLALCKRLLNDGIIENVQLVGLTFGIPGDPLEHVAALLREGLWVEVDRGWSIVPKTPRTYSETLEVKRRRARIHYHLREGVLVRDGFRCQECGASDRLEVDHIVPIARGGSDDLENLRTLCKPCNTRKGPR